MKTLLIIPFMILSTGLFSQTKNKVVNTLQGHSSSNVSIYPNPVSDKLTITFKESDSPVSVMLCDGNGRVVYSDMEVLGMLELSISTVDLKKGIYTVKINGKEGEISRKVLVN
jgi:hypothetical protein